MSHCNSATILWIIFFFDTCDLNPQLLEPKACSAHAKCHNKMGWNAHSKCSVWSSSWQAVQCIVTAATSLWRMVEKQRGFHLEHSPPQTASWQNLGVLSSTLFWVSPGPNLYSRGFSGKYNTPIWMNMFAWSAGTCAEEPDWNRPVLTLPMFCGQVGSVGYWRKCLILTYEKLNLKPTHSGFSRKTIFLGMPVIILGKKQCGNFQIQIKIRCKRREERLEKKRSW